MLHIGVTKVFYFTFNSNLLERIKFIEIILKNVTVKTFILKIFEQEFHS